MGIVLYSTKRKGLQGVRIDDKINKTGFTFELGSNGKAQKDIIRNVAVISAFVRQSLYKKICNLNSALNYNEEGTGTFILNALKIAL